VSEAIVAASVCPNIYLELSSLMPHHLADVLAHVPSWRLMIGSDLPESLETEMSKIMTLETTREGADILWNSAGSIVCARELGPDPTVCVRVPSLTLVNLAKVFAGSGRAFSLDWPALLKNQHL